MEPNEAFSRGKNKEVVLYSVACKTCHSRIVIIPKHKEQLPDTRCCECHTVGEWVIVKEYKR